jgi:hypothetical protein
LPNAVAERMTAVALNAVAVSATAFVHAVVE